MQSKFNFVKQYFLCLERICQKFGFNGAYNATYPILYRVIIISRHKAIYYLENGGEHQNESQKCERFYGLTIYNASHKRSPYREGVQRVKKIESFYEKSLVCGEFPSWNLETLLSIMRILKLYDRARVLAIAMVTRPGTTLPEAPSKVDSHLFSSSCQIWSPSLSPFPQFHSLLSTYLFVLRISSCSWIDTEDSAQNVF